MFKNINPTYLIEIEQQIWKKKQNNAKIISITTKFNTFINS